MKAESRFLSIKTRKNSSFASLSPLIFFKDFLQSSPSTSNYLRFSADPSFYCGWHVRNRFGWHNQTVAIKDWRCCIFPFIRCYKNIGATPHDAAPSISADRKRKDRFFMIRCGFGQVIQGKTFLLNYFIGLISTRFPLSHLPLLNLSETRSGFSSCQKASHQYSIMI